MELLHAIIRIDPALRLTKDYILVKKKKFQFMLNLPYHSGKKIFTNSTFTYLIILVKRSLPV
jgi:hypothetical protein